MTDLALSLPALRRPRLLVETARIGAEALLRAGSAPSRLGLRRLLSEELEMDRKRKDGEADYSPRRHVDLLIKVLVSARAASAA